MKKRNMFLLTLILAVSFNGLILAQNVPIDFEAGSNGAAWTWTVFENETNPAVEIIPNPDASGINTSATVAKFTALQNGNPWAGVESNHGSDLGTFVLDTSNAIIKIMVWKPVISDVGIKLVAEQGWAKEEIKVANTVINQWEELTFDFSSYENPPESEGPYDQIVVFPDFDLSGRTQDNICYFDNITFSSTLTSVEEIIGEIPTTYSLKQNYPNPFNPTTTVEFSIPEAGVYKLDVFNILGQSVAQLINKDLQVGNYKSTFDASNLSSGLYFYKLSGKNVNITKKMLLMK